MTVTVNFVIRDIIQSFIKNTPFLILQWGIGSVKVYNILSTFLKYQEMIMVKASHKVLQLFWWFEANFVNFVTWMIFNAESHKGLQLFWRFEANILNILEIRVVRVKNCKLCGLETF